MGVLVWNPVRAINILSVGMTLVRVFAKMLSGAWYRIWRKRCWLNSLPIGVDTNDIGTDFTQG